LGTHGPFTRKRFPKCDVRIEDAGSTDDARSLRFESLRIYVCLLERLDRHMRDFVAWLERRRRPVVLFAYGDHLPPLGPELEAHLDGSARPAGAPSSAAMPRITETPLVVWSNTGFALPPNYRSGFNFLAVPILRAAGLPARCQFELLTPLRERTDFIHPNAMSNAAATDPRLASELDRYWSLTYRLLFEDRPWVPR
jgi:hypothetical protein